MSRPARAQTRKPSEEIPEPFVSQPGPQRAAPASVAQIEAQKKQALAAIQEVIAQPAEAAPVANEESIPWFRRCPICWGRRKGYGSAYSTQKPLAGDWPENKRRRFYKCDQALTELGPCGHTWVATVESQVIRVESRPVQIETRDG